MSDSDSAALLASFLISSALTAVGTLANDSDIGDVNNIINQAQAAELISTDVGSANKAYVSIYSSDKPIGEEMSFSRTVLRQHVSKAEIPVQSEMQCVTEGSAYIAQHYNLFSDFAKISCASDDGSVNNYSCTIPESSAFNNADGVMGMKCTKNYGFMVMNEDDDIPQAEIMDIS